MFKNLKKRIISQNKDDLLTVTLKDCQEIDDSISSLKDLWLNLVEREPATGPPIYEIVDNEFRCNQVCQILQQDPYLPNVIGIDGEFISGPGPWFSWPERHKTFPVAKQNSSGPFLRFLQIARADGYVAVFDVMALKGLPKSVLNLLTNNTTTRFGFSWRSDHSAIDRLISPEEDDYKTLCPLGEVFDVQRRWNYLSSPLCSHRICAIPFDPCGNGLADFVRSAFNVNADKSHQGSGMYWNKPAHSCDENQLKYAALDALLHLDLGLLFSHWGLWSRGLASKVKFRSVLRNVEKPSLMPKIPPLIPRRSDMVPERFDESRDQISEECQAIAEPFSRRTRLEADEMTNAHRSIVQHDATMFQRAWARFFENSVGGHWNAYAFLYRNGRFKWYHKRYPSYARLMSTCLERKMNSAILNKRPAQLKRLQKSVKPVV